MSSGKQGQDERLGRLLSRLNQQWQDATYRAIAEAGHPDIRPAHSPIFRLLGEEGARVVDLAARSGLTKQSIAYLVADLEKAGYLESTADPADARARLIRYTDRGRAAEAELARISRGLEEEASQRVGSDRLAAAKAVLREILGQA
ncbi:MarR family winged helix-turn-helix transcriptional regulator [Sphingomicrobium aestuariivivum]|uniref:MarR family winged helix-turn-helix transcriptional regulator n=1 Tax=Sphingomicrobium aestuariivivum TaxID=1582356 RepID=UPI001FD69A66|nr:MarR family winged helix-turn-helix transcriptional regulator [Sphingomicrobium aestuariivivum]MCJ8192014.1 MarR family winged helix-turn-helix transcriptional regulator [Sphingomicrobium aestuariivivum]